MLKIKRLGYIFVLFISLFVFNKILAYNEYKVGDIVKYNDIEFYVIKNSSSTEDSIKLLKKELLTVDEVNLYGGVGTDNNHVNKYTPDSVGTAKDYDGYGGMAYYTSATCGYVNNDYKYSDCINDYNLSDAKYLIDNWTKNKFKLDDLTTDSTGYSTRLITEEDLLNVGYYYNDEDELRWEKAPSWVHDKFYATMIPGYTEGYIKYVDTIGYLNPANVYVGFEYRPVVNLKKSAIEKEDKKDDTDIPDEDKKDDNVGDVNNEANIVSVPNTLQRVSIISIMMGVIIISISTIVILLRFRR